MFLILQNTIAQSRAGADAGFLEMGFIYIKVWDGFADFISFSLNIP